MDKWVSPNLIHLYLDMDNQWSARPFDSYIGLHYVLVLSTAAPGPKAKITSRLFKRNKIIGLNSLIKRFWASMWFKKS